MTKAFVIDQFPKLLEQFARIHNATVVADARVQLLKFDMNGIAVDIVPVCVSSTTPPTDEEIDGVHFFDRVEAAERISLNGIRTALAFQRFIAAFGVVPETFSFALRGIKAWAKSMYKCQVAIPPHG